MNDDSTTIDSLIKGGLIGAALGALLSKDKDEGALMGALLVAAISATLKAGEEAQKTNVPVYVEENGMLYKSGPNGKKRLIKKIKKPAGNLPERFKLK
ncbi:MAG: hypothetical protein NTZ41_12010 [Sphingobacteriales bacterium]|jgi:hypothetical protein|nr:hypothetical protein [Sphingobacteriales bacterium]